MKLIPQRKVAAQHEPIVAEVPANIRMTIPAQEELERVAVRHGVFYCFKVPPRSIVPVLVPSQSGEGLETAYRLENEQPFPGEHPHPSIWEFAKFAACPKCGAALVAREAGHVPGHRVCVGSNPHSWLIR